MGPAPLWMLSAAPRSCLLQSPQSVLRLQWPIPRLPRACLFSSMNALLGSHLCCCACTGLGARNMGAEVFKSRDRSHDLVRADNGTGVVRDVDVEGGVHLLIRVIRRRVFDHRDLVAELGREADRCLHAGVRNQSNDNELMDAVILELQIQIGVGKATGTPMLEGHDVAGLR